jgi:AcrR family transcriptional regulator
MDEVKAGRWSRRREARPGEITAAALACFAEKGFAATRLDEVAARAGITKGTLYLYFPNKEELFKAVVREGLVPLIDQAATAFGNSDHSPADRLRGAITTLAHHLLGSPLSVIPKLVVAESGNFPEIARFYVHEVVDRGRDAFAAAMHDGIARGVFRPVDPAHVLLSLVGPILFGALWKHSLAPFDDRPFDLDAVVREHVDLFLRGLAPDAGPNRESRP